MNVFPAVGFPPGAVAFDVQVPPTPEVEELDDGGVVVALPARQLGWVARLLLRVGADAEVVQPPELRAEVARLARETRARYGPRT